MKIVAVIGAILGSIGAIATIILLAVVYGTMAGGFVEYKAYHWFILPVLPNFPALTYWQVISLHLGFVLYRVKYDTKANIKKEYLEPQKSWQPLVVVIVAPWIVLLILWLIKIILF